VGLDYFRSDRGQGPLCAVLNYCTVCIVNCIDTVGAGMRRAQGPLPMPSGLDGVSTLSYLVPSTTLEEAEVITGKHSETRIKPLTLANGHGRYITATDTPERTFFPLGNGRYRIIYNTAVINL
jgi:hypothetical protein